MSLKYRAQYGFCSSIILVAACLGGCGFEDGVQLNGKIFDAVGMNTGSVKPKEPKMADRAALVVPPALDKLPEPGSGKANQPDLADVKDYDASRTASKEQLEQQQKEYCYKNYEIPKSRGDDSANAAEGPLGPCKSSVFNLFSKINKGDDENSDSQ